MRCSAALLAIILPAILLAAPATAAAQPACTAAPRAPADVRSTLEPPVAAAAGRPFTPAVLTLTWKPGAGTTPASFIVEAGSRPGLSDIGTSTTAGAELAFAIPVANGTHYVRVRGINPCGTGAASRELRVTVSGSTEPGRPNTAVLLATVHATRERLGADGFVRVMGQVRNGWNAAPAALVPVRASYESSGSAIGVVQSTFANGLAAVLKNSRLVTDTLIPPGGTGCFVLFAKFSAQAVTGLELVAGEAVAGAEALPEAITVENATLAPDDFGSLVLAADMVNRGDAAVAAPQVWTEALDLQGRVIDCRGTPVSAGAPLNPKRAIAFTQATEAPFSQARAARWWAAWSTTEAEALAATNTGYQAARQTLQRLAATADAAPEAVAAARDATRLELTAIEIGRR